MKLLKNYAWLLIALASPQANSEESLDRLITELRSECEVSMLDLGYSSNSSGEICNCYVEKLAQEISENDTQESVEDETNSPQKIDAYGMAMSCM